MNKLQDENSQSSIKGMLIGFALCVALFFGYEQYINYKYPEYAAQRRSGGAAVEATSQEAVSSQAGTPGAEKAPQQTVDSSQSPTLASTLNDQTPVKLLSDQELTITTPTAVFMFDQATGSPKSIRLTQYKQNNKPDSPNVELLDRPLAVTGFTKQPVDKDTEVLVASLPPLSASLASDAKTLSFERSVGPWLVKQSWKIPQEGYVADLEISWTNTTGEPLSLDAVASFVMGADTTKPESSFFNPGTPGEQTRFLSQVDGSDNFELISDFCEDRSKVSTIPTKLIDFFGFDHHYFAGAFFPSTAADYVTRAKSTQVGNVCAIQTISTSTLGVVAPGQSGKLNWLFWFGPKDSELITAFNPKLKTTLGLGWLDMIAQPLLLSIKGLYNIFGNYGIAIIILTILLKVLFYPLAKQAAISAAKMKKLNPEMTKLREKYKADPQRMQMELMKFMSQHKINPMKGCLPILPTIPVFFALFRVLSASIELRHAPFFGWIADLSSKDPYFITPILLTAGMFVQQKLTPMTGMDPTQEKVMLFMPLIFGVMMISLPSGLVLYMLTNTIISIAQQQYLNKKLEATV